MTRVLGEGWGCSLGWRLGTEGFGGWGQRDSGTGLQRQGNVYAGFWDPTPGGFQPVGILHPTWWWWGMSSLGAGPS